MSAFVSFVIAVLVLYLALSLVKRGAQARRSAPEAAAVMVMYGALIKARVRRVSRSQSFTAAKNALGGIWLSVTADSIRVEPVGLFPGLARRMGVNFCFSTDDVSMRRDRIGWIGLGARERPMLVLSGMSNRHDVEVAILPNDGDLDRLERCLTEAGVHGIEN